MLMSLPSIAFLAIINISKMSTAAAIATTATSSSTTIDAFAIGTTGTPWSDIEIKQWRTTRVKHRSYFDDVVPRIEALRTNNDDLLYDVIQYGNLPLIIDDNDNDVGGGRIRDDKGDDKSCQASSSSSSSFPLFAIKTRDWSKDTPNVLVTGGVHGYETSGVEGALLFLESKKAEHYSKYFNIVVAPCISPWGYERIQRWNANGVDPNRSFNPEGEIVKGRSFNPEAATEESAALIQFLQNDMKKHFMDNDDDDDPDFICHLDLHETTDTDETEFGPTKAARDGTVNIPSDIPDGFYLVQDETSPQADWFKAMIDSVRTVTHIAQPTNADETLIGEKITQEGVIQIPNNKNLGLCAGVTDAPYRATTEVYPDSSNATPEQCNRAQVACIEGALDHIISML
mmetsp:Transcript_44995/g.50436  ORF Transcript_44995/g.50436 Transcript_44995/m.50436 type:complete len:400 (-) Transcript_44995:300-1499(-)